MKVKAEKDLAPGAEALESPYDTDARFRTTRDTQWTGYMVHLTETCEPNTVNLLTHVVTTPASVHEVKCTAAIHRLLSTNSCPLGTISWMRPMSKRTSWSGARRTTLFAWSAPPAQTQGGKPKNRARIRWTSLR